MKATTDAASKVIWWTWNREPKNTESWKDAIKRKL